VNIDNGFGAGYLAACINGNAAGANTGGVTEVSGEAHASRVP